MVAEEGQLVPGPLGRQLAAWHRHGIALPYENPYRQFVLRAEVELPIGVLVGEGNSMSMPGGKLAAERTRDKLSLLRNHPLFRDLPPGVIEHLGSYMKTRRVARGTSIFAKGEPGTGLMGVLAGA